MSRSSLLLAGFLWAIAAPFAQAQLIPDSTLGSENSQVTPLEAALDRIDGGAVRGANLFHSFQEFNINSGHSVYFANPAAIENILTRVTGGNSSAILGRLGVFGEANLWLLNPNGIYFGPEASLDIRGSFVATTADGLWLGDQGYFSATDTAGSQLLAVQPGALFTQALAAHQRQLENHGPLQVGGDLTLAAGRLLLQGQLEAGGDLTLHGEAVQIRDQAAQPFIAAAGGDLVVEGRDRVDIFALNHGDSGLLAGGNLWLRSQNPVVGDAHFYAGGSFRVEQLDGSLGNLYSPEDPVIWANGDVSLAAYTGRSLHILAGGAVTIPGNITINNAEDAAFPDRFLVETVTLSDGSTLSIDGSARPTLDIRAGIDWQGAPPGNTIASGGPLPSTPAFAPTATSAAITLGNVRVLGTGQVFLSNQYAPNLALDSGASGITFNSIDTSNSGNAGSVIIDARGDVTVNGEIKASSALGLGGPINLLSQGNLTLQPGSLVHSFGALGGAIALRSGGTLRARQGEVVSLSGGPAGAGGPVTLSAPALSLEGGSLIGSVTTGAAQAGDVTLNAADLLHLQGQNAAGEGVRVFSEVFAGASGNSGRVTVNTGQLEVQDGGLIGTITRGQGTAGAVTLEVSDSIRLRGQDNSGNQSGIGSQVTATATGNAGAVAVNTGRLDLLEGARIGINIFGQGQGGTVTINVRETARFQGENSQGVSGLFNRLLPGAVGSVGGIVLNTGSLEALDGALISTSTFGQGDAGAVTINAREAIRFQGSSSKGERSGAFSQVSSSAQGNAGSVTIRGDRLEVLDGAFISATTFGRGNAGQVVIETQDSVRFQGESPLGFASGAFSQVEPQAQGRAGGLRIETGRLEVLQGARISSTTFGQGDAAVVVIQARDRVHLAGESSQGRVSGLLSRAGSAAQGQAGGIILQTGHLEVSSRAMISAGTAGPGNGGDLAITANTIDLDQASLSVTSQGSGRAGNIQIQGNSLTLRNGARIAAETLQTDGGNIQIDLQDILLLRHGSRISTTAGTAQAGGDGGNIDITARFVVGVPQENSDITANAFSGRGGNINITANAIYGLAFRDRLTPFSDITASSEVGINGTLIFNPLSFPAEQGLTETPATVAKADDQIQLDSCAIAGSLAANRSFTVTGRGGLPTNPYDLLAPTPLTLSWGQREPGTTAPVVVQRAPGASAPLAAEALRQAQGWVALADGTVVLTADATEAQAYAAPFLHPNCQDLGSGE